MNFNTEVGNRIRNARIRKGLSMKELGEAVNLSEGTIQRYETGQIKAVDVNLLKKIAKVINCSEAYLMSWESVDKEEIPQTIALYSTGDLTDEEQEKVLEYIKFLKTQRGQ